MSAVKQCALKHGIAVEQPASLRDDRALQRLQSWSADVMVVVAYGLILPGMVLKTPALGCINIHASLLPRWRGAAPIQRTILAGDAITGITIMRMDAGLDTGPILLAASTPIAERETAGSLHDRLAALGSHAVLEALSALAEGSLQERDQPAEGGTYAAKIRKEEAEIHWPQTVREIDRQIRAFNPWPVAQTLWRGGQMRIWEAMPSDLDMTAPAGTVVRADATGIRVATGAGVLNVTRVQMAGRKAMTAAQFLNAHRIVGAVLGTASA